jgi:uncharacterized membrane protein (DUF4010 family)
MKKELYIGTVTFVLVIALIYMPTGYAQNLTTNASNAMGNASANASASANQTGANIVNKTGEVGQKIAGGAANLLGNASEKLKEGIGAK